MANALPNKPAQPNGSLGVPHLTSAHEEPGKNGATALKGRGLSHGLAHWERHGGAAGEAPEGDPAADGPNVERLLAENAELNQALHELQHILEESEKREHAWTEQQKEYESLLEEKSEVIRGLHQKLQELQEKVRIAPTPREEELIALSDELDRERCRLQQERKSLEQEKEQLQEDEEHLMKQMREMEVQMSRERAELARQRNELQRLHADIRHELELASRDATLRERLMPLQRRHQELMHRKGGAPSAAREQAPPPEPEPAPNAKEERGKDSGLLRRFFGSGGK
jgi:chromosome segregation ATPase